MMLPRLRFVHLPSILWDPPGDDASLDAREFYQCIRDARDIEARLLTSPDREADRRRYSAACRRIEETAALLNGATTATPVGAEYLQLIGRLVETRNADSRLAATFFAPGEVARLRAAIEPTGVEGIGDALAVLNRAHAYGDGIVILTEAYADVAPAPLASSEPSVEVRVPVPAAAEEGPASAEESRTLLDALRRHIAAALPHGSDDRVPLGAFPDAAITRVLHEAVYAAGEAAMVVPVYTDGSRGAPFPVRCRPSPPRPPDGGMRLRVALVSMRHLELDAHVDSAWFRNRDVSTARSAGETEALCAEITATRLRQLRAAVPAGMSLTITIYQTGLPQAVIGFYRGVVAALQGAGWPPGTLAVVPMFYQPWIEARYASGRAWT
jgi:hypothetical protein